MVKAVGGDTHYLPPNMKISSSQLPKVKYHPILSLFQKTKTYRIRVYIGNQYEEKVIESRPCHIKWNDSCISYLKENSAIDQLVVWDSKDRSYTIEELSLDKNENLVEKLIATNKEKK